MATTAPRTHVKLALVPRAFALSLLLALSPLLVQRAQAQFRQPQRQRRELQRQLRPRTALGVNPYQDPYRRNVFRTPYRNPYEEVGEVPVVEDVDRFRQGVERFR